MPSGPQKIMQDRAIKNEKISFLWNAAVDEILGDDVVTGLRVRDVKTDQRQDLPCAGVFVAIGHTPNTKIFKEQVDRDEQGYILTKSGSTATNIPGVFAAGDVQDSYYRQAVTAAGSGCMAAIDAERFLESHP